MNYKEKIDTFVKVVKEAIEEKTSMQLILNSELAYDIAKELYYENKDRFEDYTEDMFDELLSENGILSVCVLHSSDGRTKLFLQLVFDNEGDTLVDDYSDCILIADELYDCIDINAFECIVATIKEHDEDSECKVCNCCGCILEDKEFEEENLFKTLTDELLATIGEYAVNDKHLAYKMICDKLEEVYELGKDDMQEEIQELVESIRF